MVLTKGNTVSRLLKGLLKFIKQQSVLSLCGYIFLYLWIAFIIFLFTWTIYTSIKTNREFFADVWGLPKGINLDGYKKAWITSKMGNYFFNSIFIVSFSTVASALLSSPAAYVLSRIPFRGRGFIITLFIMGMAIPGSLVMVPTFMLLRSLKLLDNLIGLGIIYTTRSLAFTIFMLSAFFKSLPTGLEEASVIDGASAFQSFWRIMLPLAKTGIVTVSIFNFLGFWKDFFWALILLFTESKKTVSLGLYSLQTSMRYSADWVGLFAGCVIVMLPSLIFYLFVSKRLVSGLTIGAIKG